MHCLPRPGLCMAWMQELRSKRRDEGQQPKCSCQQSFYSALKKKKNKHFVAAQPISPQQYVLSCVFRPQAGSSMTGKDKVIMWSLPAWPTPPSLLYHVCTAPHNAMQCLFLSDKLPRSPLNSNFIIYWEGLSPPSAWELPVVYVQGNPSGKMSLSISVY